MKPQAEAGFSYIDVMCGLLILMIGILAMLSAMTAAVVQTAGQEQQLTAKQVGSSTLESIMSVKETRNQTLGWARLANCNSPCTGANQLGIFPRGKRYATTGAGADQIIGTEDDTGSAGSGFQREIIITDKCEPQSPSSACSPAGSNEVMVRQVDVIVTYPINGLRGQETFSTVLTNYAPKKKK